MWSRRTFIRTGALSVIGSIFVPRYERWFRPLIVAPKPSWYALVFDAYNPARMIEAALDWDGREWKARFPPMLSLMNANAAMLLNARKQPVTPIHIDTPKALYTGDQLIFSMRNLILDDSETN